jgi:MFS family permease
MSDAADITPEEADRASTDAAVTLALTLPGDTVLYLLLPIYAATFGVSLPEAGILLAANRLIRIIGYGWVARFYAARGPRVACLWATLGSVVSAALYATASGLWPLLVGRLLWGLSFAAMNLANQALPTASMEGAARRMGRSRAIISIGPAVGLVLGAIVAQQAGPRIVFMALAAVSALAFLAAHRLPSHQEHALTTGPRFERPGAISLWSFAFGLTLDGIFIFGLGLLAAAHTTKGAVLAAGLALALRYVTEVAFSPLSGRLAHRYGARPMLVAASLGSALGLALVATEGWLLWTAVIATIVLRALAQPLTAPMVAEVYPGPARVPALARQATWRDIGAGAGPLLAGVLLPVAPALAVYLGSGLLLAVTTVMLMRLRVGAPLPAHAP